MGMLETIAIPTGKAKIIEVIAAAKCLGNNVIDGEERANDLFLTAAIAASMVSAAGYFAPQRTDERRHSPAEAINSLTS